MTIFASQVFPYVKTQSVQPNPPAERGSTQPPPVPLIPPYVNIASYIFYPLNPDHGLPCPLP